MLQRLDKLRRHEAGTKLGSVVRALLKKKYPVIKRLSKAVLLIAFHSTDTKDSSRGGGGGGGGKGAGIKKT